jgi:hypothetical protein
MTLMLLATNVTVWIVRTTEMITVTEMIANITVADPRFRST